MFAICCGGSSQAGIDSTGQVYSKQDDLQHEWKIFHPSPRGSSAIKTDPKSLVMKTPVIATALLLCDRRLQH